MEQTYTIDLNKVSMKDLLLVGGKNASLGEMIQNLTQQGIKIPGGFAITSSAYWAFTSPHTQRPVLLPNRELEECGHLGPPELGGV